MRTTTGTGLTAWSRRCMASLKEENERLRAALEAARIVLRDLVDVGIAFNGIVDPNGPEAQALKKVVAALGLTAERE